MTKSRLGGAALLAALLFAVSPAHALSSRAWVSGHGTDALGCGAPTSPCRSFQFVHDNIIAAGGEIDVLDPAGYGAVTITKAVSIVNDGVGTAGVQQATSGANAITINAASTDNVTLRGLNIDGLDVAANGVEFNSGGGLTVVNCVIRHFHGATGIPTSGNGILIQPTTGSVAFLISDVIASDNGLGGVVFEPQSGAPSATGVIARVTAVNNATGGIIINTSSAIGGTVTAALSYDIASNSSGDGMTIFGGGGNGVLTVSIDNSTMNADQSHGLSTAHATVLLGRSVVTSNGTGVNNPTTNTLFSYGDNRVDENGVDLVGTLNPKTPR